MVTVQGAVVRLLAADAALAALVPGGVYGGSTPEEKSLPFLLVKDAEDKHQWITEFSRIETHRVTVTAWAKSGGVAGGDHPAESVMARVEAVLNWQDLAIPNTVPVRFRQTKHAFNVEGKRAPDKERVGKSVRSWEVVFERVLA